MRLEPIIQFRSCQCYKVVKSAMAAGTVAFSAVFVSSFLLGQRIELMAGCSLALLMLTDSKPLFDVLISNTRTSAARLILYVFAMHQAYTRRDFDKIGFIGKIFNLADDLTKLEGNTIMLLICSMKR